MQIVNGPGTTPNGTFALRRAPPWAAPANAEQLAAALSSNQIDALTKMAKWAESNLKGVQGKTTLNGKEIPQAAYNMREQFKGNSYGGKTDAQLREQRKEGRISIRDLETARSGAPTATNGNGG